MTIRLYNTKTRTKEDFSPLDPANVRMYVCGPTVYDRAHIGNARPVVVFDVLYRLLRHTYGEGAVTYVRNFTDVDDKINAKAIEIQQGGETLVETVRRITNETIDWYHEDMDALGALRPTHEPRATEYIAQMIAMGEDLIERGHAYVAEGHVLFEARTDPEYGSLSRRPLDEMRAGARVEVAPYKRDPMDSVIWKPSTDDQPGWDSPWGRGRPGWHIECSAMAGDLLGEHFDIHGGGIDLQFPHHENECAQSRCVGHQFANVWMHNGYLQVEGEKMSKSLGNFFTVADLREKNIPGEVMRLAMLMTHYRSPIDWTSTKLKEAELLMFELQGLLGSGGSTMLRELEPTKPFDFVLKALSDDLNTPLALTKMLKKNLRRELGKTGLSDFLGEIYATQLLLGFDFKESEHAKLRASRADEMGALVDVHVDGFEDARLIAAKIDDARREKDFARADAIRDLLVKAGLEVRSGTGGTQVSILPHFDPTMLPEVEDV